MLAAELMSHKTGEFGQRYFDSKIATDTSNELGLPAEPELRRRLLSEVYRTAQLAADGGAVLAAELAAIAGLVATLVIAVQSKKQWAAWTSGVAALLLILLAFSLLVQLLEAKLSRYVVGKPMSRWKKVKSDEPSAARRFFNNALVVISGYAQRIRSLGTLTAYKTSIILAAILSAVIGAVI